MAWLMPLFSLRAIRAFLSMGVLASALALGASNARAASPYQNPFAGEQPYVGRTDMGVDLCLSPGDPIRAIGDGVVTGIIRNWDGREPYVFYQLTSGPSAGRYVYVAEQITGLPKIGQTLHAGDVVARYAKGRWFRVIVWGNGILLAGLSLLTFYGFTLRP